MSDMHPRSLPLTGLDRALSLLLEGVRPVAATPVPLVPAPGKEAVPDGLAGGGMTGGMAAHGVAAHGVPVGEFASGGVAAEAVVAAAPVPLRDEAVLDGFALASADIAGATALSPAFLAAPPAWVEAGEPMPEGSDCVLEAGLAAERGGAFEVTGEAAPGDGVRRAGADLAAGAVLVPAGAAVTPRHLVPARRAGLEAIAVRRPRVRLIDVAANDGRTESLALIRALLGAEGAEIAASHATARDAGAIAAALGTEGADLLLAVGGTGPGRSDAMATAIAARGTLLAHGIALSPGRSAALGRIDAVPVLALPGAPEGALTAWLALGLPLLDRLAGRRPRMAVPLPLARKIASTVGLCELALLKREGAAWQPLAVGAFPLGLLAAAEAWLAVPAASEGHAAGETVAGFLFGGAP